MIGVMLMLVITVLLAAAVSSFTGGLKAQKPAPTANFDVKIVKNATTDMGTCTYMQITEISGDRIPTKDLEIITYNPDAYVNTSNIYAKEHQYEFRTQIIKPNSMNTYYYSSGSYSGPVYINNSTATKSIKALFEWSGWVKGTSPYLNNMAYGYFGEHDIKFTVNIVINGTTVTKTYYNKLPSIITISSAYNLNDITNVTILESWKPDNPKVDFGNYTVHPGVTLTADWYSNYPQAKWNGNSGKYNIAGDPNAGNVTGFCACIADGWNVTPGHYITVKIVYTPTHTVIWEKKVLVEGEGI